MRAVFAALLLAQPVLAETVVATRTIRAQTIVAPDDLTLVAADLPGALTSAGQAVGLETRVTIYAGRPVRLTDLGSAALVERNQVVPLIFLAGELTILTEGRALGRASEGELIRVINIASRSTVSGRVGPDGAVYVGKETRKK